MRYVTARELSVLWNISVRRIEVLCAENRIRGAIRIGRYRVIPKNAIKPADARKRGGYREKSSSKLKEGCFVPELNGEITADYEKLIQELRSYPDETQWLEFKHNNYNPAMIGRDISALANSAALLDRTYTYMIWGIGDSTHEITGTEYSLSSLRKGDQELDNRLHLMLSDNDTSSSKMLPSATRMSAFS